METSNLDDLELELRKLPGVRAAGFTERDDMLLVQVQVSGEEPSANLSHQAARIAYRHADKPVALEVVRWRTIQAAAPVAPVAAVADSTDAANASIATRESDSVDVIGVGTTDQTPRQRVRMLAVLTFPDTDELEVHLTFGGRRIIGRASATLGINAAATATVEGLQTFAPTLGGTVTWAIELTEYSTESAYVVACAVALAGGDCLGIAAGGSRIEAAARATLHALNRSVEQALTSTD